MNKAIRSALLTARSVKPLRRGYDDGGDVAPAEVARAAPAAADTAAIDAASQTAGYNTSDQNVSAPDINAQISQAYQDVLGRTADQGGLDHYSGLLGSGSSINDIYSQLFSSDEFTNNMRTAGYGSGDQNVSAQTNENPNAGVLVSNTPQGPDAPLPAYLKPFDYSQYSDPLSARYAYLSSVFNPTVAAGLMGGFQVESANNPTQLQSTGGFDSAPLELKANGLPLGYGSAQWGKDRLQSDGKNPNAMGLIDFANKYGFDPNTTEGQDRFIAYEGTQNPYYSKILNRAMSLGDNQDAVTRVLQRSYEAPAESALADTMDDRIDYSHMYRNYFDKGPSAVSADQIALINQTLARIQDPGFNKQYAGPTIESYMASLDGPKNSGSAGVNANPDPGSLTQNASLFGNGADAPNVLQEVNGNASGNLNANIGGNGLLTDTFHPETNSTNITGTNIIPWNQGLDPTLGSSTNGIPFGFHTSGIDTGANPLGEYNISPGGGMGPGGFDFNMFNRGGAVDRALMVAHRAARAAGGMIGQTPEMDGERALDRMNRILSQRAKSGAFEDDQSRKYDYLQNAPGAQVRGPTFARGGYADGGSADDDIVSQALDVTRDAPPLTPAEIARRWTPPEESGAKSPDWPEWAKEGAQNYTGNVGKSFTESGEYARHGLENTVSDKGAGYNIIGPAQYMLGSAGQLMSPLTGAAMSAGDAATELTGNPEFGKKVELLGGFIDPTHAGALGKMSHYAPAVGSLIPTSKAVSKALEITAPERQLNDIGLYSHAAEVSSMLPQAKGTPEQMAAMLQKQGVKPAEMEGFTEAFAGKPSVTREELAQHFNERMPQVEETVLGAKANKYPYRDSDEWQAAINQAERRRDFDEAERLTMAWEESEGIGAQGTPKYQKHTLPGGENYREVLLKHDNGVTPEEIKLAEQKMRNAIHKSLNFQVNLHRTVTPEQAAQAMSDAKKASQDLKDLKARANPLYQSSHWDEPNVLAHLRLADRTGPNGEKILHVEEIQSDWGQKGKKEGFQPPNVDKLEARRREIEGYGKDATPEQKQEWANIMNQLRPNTRDVEGASAYKGVPSAPYVTSTQGWTDLALKRALREAAEGGYDKLVWTPGAEQAKRYSLSNHVDEVQYSPGRNGTHSVEAYKGNNNVFNKPNATIKEIADTFGQEIADKIASGHGEVNRNTGYNVLSGLDLETGGSGMKGYYDKIVPNQLSKLVKKLDPSAKVGMTDVLLPPKGGIGHNNPPFEAPGITITPLMRERIMKGQTAYADGGSVDYQSTGDVVMPDTGIPNWGDAENKADFFRASQALMDKQKADEQAAAPKTIESRPLPAPTDRGERVDPDQAKAPTVVGAGDTVFPVVGTFSGGPRSYYGAERPSLSGYMRLHAGADWQASNGSGVYAPVDGKVVYSGQHSGYGNMVDVLGSDGYVRRFAVHDGDVLVKPGDAVSAGQQIGTVGGQHLHHEVLKPDSSAATLATKGQFGQTSRVGGKDEQTLDPSSFYKLKSGTKVYGPAGLTPPAARKDGGRVGNITYHLDPDVQNRKHAGYSKEGGRITWMSPEEFLQKVPQKLKLDRASEKTIEHFKEKIKKGKKLNPLAIFPNSGGQDGRHRAMAAKELGVKKVPVILWPEVKHKNTIVDRALMITSRKV